MILSVHLCHLSGVRHLEELEAAQLGPRPAVNQIEVRLSVHQLIRKEIMKKRDLLLCVLGRSLWL